jgi:hypothetical protein
MILSCIYYKEMLKVSGAGYTDHLNLLITECIHESSHHIVSHKNVQIVCGQSKMKLIKSELKNLIPNFSFYNKHALLLLLLLEEKSMTKNILSRVSFIFLISAGGTQYVSR